VTKAGSEMCEPPPVSSVTGISTEAESEHEPTGSALDRWWGRVLSTPLRQWLWYWGGPLGVTVLAAVLRLVHLGSPHSLVFDETFYVKDAYTLLNNGYESSWVNDADARFNSGDTDVFTTNPSYVVHPPLGKWMIALGLAVFGAGDSFGWRISTALVGIVAVFVLVLVARTLTNSTLLGVVAGFLFAVDGNAIVMSRVSLLDNFVMFFALLGFGAVVLDRRWHTKWLAERVGAARHRGKESPWGLMSVWRPWVIVAGTFFGCASAVKWSGVYFLVVFGVYLVVVDILARRRLGVPFWARSGLLSQGPITFLLFVPVALASYVASWTGWLVTTGGMYRSWATTDGEPWMGGFSWVPVWFQNLWHYHASAYTYHIGLTTPHPYQSNPLTWLFMVRPTNMYYEGSVLGENGCQSTECASQITGLGNPIIWWAATAALIYLLYRFIRRQESPVGLVLAGMVAGYMPWLLYMNRTVFEFYSITFEPYMILALTIVLGIILGQHDDHSWKRKRGIGLMTVYLGFVTLLSVFFWPVWSAEQIPFWYWQLHSWLPTWR
jgi:dolichyl-phosphate-mannose-protein mannosyltransferase